MYPDSTFTTMSTTLSVLSLNCWGLFMVSKEREFRLHAIADYIASTNYDVVALQELWMWDDFEYIKTVAANKYPNIEIFYSGALGSGLAILSKFPIIEQSYFRYALSGRPLKVFHGDFYVGKGCGSVCVDHPEAGLIDIYTTHLHAGYGRRKEYEGHRITEAWELTKLFRSSAASGRHVIALGDFNAIPSSYPYRLITEHGKMSDSWQEVNGPNIPSSPEIEQLTPEAAIQVLGVTCDSPLNSWSKHFLKKSAHKKYGDRLDYIFYERTPKLQCVQSKVVLTETIPGTEKSYSDHFGVCSTFKISTKVAHEVVSNNSQYTNLTRDTLDGILATLRSDQYHSKRTAKFLLRLLAITLIAIIVLFAIIIALPTSLRMNDHGDIAIILVTIFGQILLIASALIAPVALIVGFVFGHTEQRALLQFIKELETLFRVIKINHPSDNDLINMTDDDDSSTNLAKRTNIT
ncbi:Endonuclease/exonuclease/phosphatase [Umbelopsis sp. AD052]|nr:Endonuclease/exonuclease/phosphatase [Umbelopsis sp. AD052]